MTKVNPYLFVGSITAIIIAMVVVTLMFTGINEDAVRLVIRETARTSLLLFLMTFMTRPFQKLLKNNLSKWLMINRRYLGISFGISHLIHMSLIIWLIITFAEGDWLSIAPLSSYIIGGIGYLFILAMLATSNDRAIKKLGRKRWKLLHTTGMYSLYLIFLVSYLGLIEVNQAFYLPIFALLIAAGGIRLYALRTRSRKAITV